MTDGVSTFRLYLMRGLYLLVFAVLGSDVWPALVRPEGAWDPMRGVAFSFWGALSLLAALGLRYPLQMLPLLLVQLLYKAIWLVAVGLPLRAAGEPPEMMGAFVVGVVLDLVVIPWPYVWANYARKPGDRWRAERAGAATVAESR